MKFYDEEDKYEDIINPVTLDAYYMTAEDYKRIQEFIIREEQKEKEILSEEDIF